MIRVGHFDWKTHFTPSCEIDGVRFTVIVCHPGKKYPYGALDPFHIKTKDGYFIENEWQFRKIYERVPKQNQLNYVEGHQGKVKIWEHPAEVHMVDGKPNEAYFRWREKGLNHDFAVRYPVGFKNRHTCKGLVDKDGSILGYAEARKVYVSAYTESDVREHPLYKDLKERLKNGENFMICEVDGPQYNTSFPYNTLPKDDKSKWSLLMTPEIMKGCRWNTDRPFGHGYVLAGMLLDMEEEMF